jgi:hypothetical protein
MTRYISNPDHLKQQMNLLKEKSKNIQFEAFHVFKVMALPLKKRRSNDFLGSCLDFCGQPEQTQGDLGYSHTKSGEID